MAGSWVLTPKGGTTEYTHPQSCLSTALPIMRTSAQPQGTRVFSYFQRKASKMIQIGFIHGGDLASQVTERRDQDTFSVKAQLVNILGLKG